MKWRETHLPRVQAATRPNARFVQRPDVLALLQHLSDGLSGLLMARPLSPLAWLGDFLRQEVSERTQPKRLEQLTVLKRLW